MWVSYSLFIHSPTEERFGFFKFGVIMDKAAVNTRRFMCVCKVSDQLGEYLGAQLLGIMVRRCLAS